MPEMEAPQSAALNGTMCLAKGPLLPAFLRAWQHSGQSSASMMKACKLLGDGASTQVFSPPRRICPGRCEYAPCSTLGGMVGTTGSAALRLSQLSLCPVAVLIVAIKEGRCMAVCERNERPVGSAPRATLDRRDSSAKSRQTVCLSYRGNPSHSLSRHLHGVGLDQLP